jgi:hypothetical protein
MQALQPASSLLCTAAGKAKWRSPTVIFSASFSNFFGREERAFCRIARQSKQHQAR